MDLVYANDPLEGLYDQVLVRYGEIGLKGKNRHVFEDRLVRNMQKALTGLPPRKINRTFGRMFVPLDGDAREVLPRLQKVFGIVSLSPVVTVDRDLDEIKEWALKLAHGHGGSFRVDVRRADKSFPQSSIEMNRLLGAHLLKEYPHLHVDLEHPELTVSVEIRPEGTYMYSRTWPGPGGLPLGSSGRGILLLSGGIDSPVAGWMMMKRGLELMPLHFHSPPFTSERSKEKVLDLCRVLASYAGSISLHLCHFTEVQKAIHRECPADLGVIIMRRMMMRIAAQTAFAKGALALVTGESLGQVASQTIESISVISQASPLPILRPLVGMDKDKIVDQARLIGTYETSILPFDDCCTLFVPRHPQTRPQLSQVEKAEEPLAIAELVQEAVDKTEVIEIGG
jgi:thiamine biosynthesis protein ThiI